jgi:hypothetical protein
MKNGLVFFCSTNETDRANSWKYFIHSLRIDQFYTEQFFIVVSFVEEVIASFSLAMVERLCMECTLAHYHGSYVLGVLLLVEG